MNIRLCLGDLNLWPAIVARASLQAGLSPHEWINRELAVDDFLTELEGQLGRDLRESVQNTLTQRAWNQVERFQSGKREHASPRSERRSTPGSDVQSDA